MRQLTEPRSNSRFAFITVLLILFFGISRSVWSQEPTIEIIFERELLGGIPDYRVITVGRHDIEVNSDHIVISFPSPIERAPYWKRFLGIISTPSQRTSITVTGEVFRNVQWLLSQKEALVLTQRSRLSIDNRRDRTRFPLPEHSPTDDFYNYVSAGSSLGLLRKIVFTLKQRDASFTSAMAIVEAFDYSEHISQDPHIPSYVWWAGRKKYLLENSDLREKLLPVSWVETEILNSALAIKPQLGFFRFAGIDISLDGHVLGFLLSDLERAKEKQDIVSLRFYRVPIEAIRRIANHDLAEATDWKTLESQNDLPINLLPFILGPQVDRARLSADAIREYLNTHRAETLLRSVTELNPAALLKVSDAHLPVVHSLQTAANKPLISTISERCENLYLASQEGRH